MGFFDIFKKHAEQAITPTAPVENKAYDCELPATLLDDLRQTTVYTLKDKADAKRAEVPGDVFSWDERPDIVANVLDDISRGLREIAASGKGKATIAFLCHSETVSKINGKRITSGVEVATKTNPVYPRIEVFARNFTRADGSDAFDTDDHTFAIVGQLRDIIRKRLVEKGFSIEPGWGDDINVSWITEETMTKIEKVLEIPGGWEALEKGVPLDDVLA